MINSLLKISIIFLICSCHSLERFIPDTPSRDFKDTLMNANAEFRQGWKDGCEVGSASGANRFYKFFYRSNAVDGYKIVNSADYKVAWGDAYWYCYRDIYVKQKSSVWGAILSGYR